MAARVTGRAIRVAGPAIRITSPAGGLSHVFIGRGPIVVHGSRVVGVYTEKYKQFARTDIPKLNPGLDHIGKRLRDDCSYHAAITLGFIIVITTYNHLVDLDIQEPVQRAIREQLVGWLVFNDKSRHHLIIARIVNTELIGSRTRRSRMHRKRVS
ncbi:hypothetical protein H106_02688 [Trichophyton rubrum CBS 735.88]|nr:hypothetical protein H106_02688 [Trichophyton rubrum CBS 735.88]